MHDDKASSSGNPTSSIMKPWSPLLASLIFLQVVTGHARHLCVTVDGECNSQLSAEIMSTPCDDVMIPILTSSGSGAGAEDGQPLHCYTLENALLQMRSNDTLHLASGTHILNNATSSVISDLSGIAILGNPSNHAEVIVTCAKEVGLSFVNVTGLTLLGFIVDGCSLSGSQAMITELDHSDEFFPHPVVADFVGAIFIVQCSDLLVENVTVQNSHGFGVVGWNLFGDSHFRQTNFLSNSPCACFFEIEDHHDNSVGQGFGGGAFIMYQDVEDTRNAGSKFTDNSLSFDGGLIANNYGCRHGIDSVIFNNLFRSVANSQNLAGAGGLSIVFGQSSFHVNATVTSYTFRNNTNLYGGAGMMVLIYELANRSDVYIIDSTFKNNGVTSRTVYGGVTSGIQGALSVLFYVPIPNAQLDKSLLLTYLHQLPSKVHVYSTLFANNSAQVGGGLSVLSFGASQSFVHDQLNLKDCTFSSNTAQHGSAIYATEITYSGFEQGLEMSLRNINVTESMGTFEAVSLNQLNVSLSGVNIFQRNRVTALSLNRAIAVFSGINTFRSNIGNNGGAIHLKTSESYIVIRDKTNVSFIANEGRIAGGAVYVSFDITSPVTYDCFVFIEEFNPFCHHLNDCSTYGVSIAFINNTAPLGTALYGSTLYNCPWSNGVHYIDYDNRTVHMIAQDIINSLHSAELWLHFYPQVNGSNNVINTQPESIVSKDYDSSPSFNVTPGGQFTLNLKALDHLLQPVPLTILSHITSPDGRDVTDARASIGATDRYLLVGAEEYTEVPISVYGMEDTSYLVIITSNEASVEFDITVNMRNCSVGYGFNNETDFPTCECEVDDILPDITCNDDGTITTDSDVWVGLLEDSGEYVQHSCILNYCNLNVTVVDLGFTDEQCADNRAGILCGGCSPTYSRVLGSTRCLSCPDNKTLGLIALFAVLGVLLVILIKIFNITITDGYINGFIFYSNILSIYLNNLSSSERMPFFVSMAFMNLNFGIETCFYSGMSQIHLTALTLVFPIYLLGILLVIVLFTEYVYLSTRVEKLFKHMTLRRKNKLGNATKSAEDIHSNIIQVLVTLLLFSYTSIIQTCFDILGIVLINTPSGTIVRWGDDPNQKYFDGIHIPLFFVALALLIVLIPIPFLLTFPRIILSWQFTHKLKPLVDAVTGPFGERRRFWLGFQLLCRLVIHFIAALGLQTSGDLVLAIIIILLLVIQSSVWPYKTMARNLLDLSLMINLTMIAVLNLYVERDVMERNVLIAFTAIAICELAFLVCYYIIVKFSFTRRISEALAKKTKELGMRMIRQYQCKAAILRRRISRQEDLQGLIDESKLSGRVSHTSLRLGSTSSNVLREALLEETEFVY